MRLLASKATMVAVWVTTILLVLDTIARLWGVLGPAPLMVALMVQLILVAAFTLRRLRLGRVAWWVDLATGALLSGLIGAALVIFSSPAQRPMLVSAWWMVFWAYVVITLLPASPLSVRVQVTKGRQSLQMQWYRLVLLTGVALMAVLYGWQLSLRGVLR